MSKQTNENSENNNDKRILYSINVAKEHGIRAAIILAFLAYKISKSKNVRDGKRWYYAPIREIAERFPYCSETGVDEILRSLKTKGIIEFGRFNKKGYDRTRWYTFKSDDLRKDAQTKRYSFMVSDAVKYGVNEAVVLAHICYWIITNRKKNPEYRWQRVSAVDMAKVLPFSPSGIRKALRTLVKENAIERKKGTAGDKANCYRIKDESRLRTSNPVEDHSNPGEQVHKSVMEQPNPEIHQPNPVNNTHYKEPLKDTVKDTIERTHYSMNDVTDVNKLNQSQLSTIGDSYTGNDSGLAITNQSSSSPAPDVADGADRQSIPESGYARFKYFEARRAKFRTPDADKRDIANLSAKEKALILKNALSTENRVYSEKLFSWSNRGVQAVTRFFERNPRATAGQILSVMQNCRQVKCREVPEGFDPYYASRLGTNLSCLLGNMENIVTEVGLLGEFDNVTFLSKEDLGLKKQED
jgi:hypothetical protein